VEFAYVLLQVAGQWATLTPTHARAVVGANTRRARKVWLDQAPARRRVAAGGVKNHSGAALADAIDMQLVTTNIHELAGWRKVALVDPLRHGLIDQTRAGDRNQENNEAEQNPPNPYQRSLPWPLPSRFRDRSGRHSGPSSLIRSHQSA
jgi:hypothetical protein